MDGFTDLHILISEFWYQILHSKEANQTQDIGPFLQRNRPVMTPGMAEACWEQRYDTGERDVGNWANPDVKLYTLVNLH